MHKSFVSFWLCVPAFVRLLSFCLVSQSFAQFCSNATLPSPAKRGGKKEKCTFKNREKGYDTSGCKILVFLLRQTPCHQNADFRAKKPSQLSKSPSFQSFFLPCCSGKSGLWLLEINFPSLSRTHTWADWIKGRQLFFSPAGIGFCHTGKRRTGQLAETERGQFQR